MKTSESERLREWERAMRSGTDAARCGQALMAEGLYLKALALSRGLLEQPAVVAEHADDCVAALVVSHLNLAELHAETGHVELAAAYLCSAHCELMSLLQGPAADPLLRQAALRHSRETHAALLEHLQRHGNDDTVLAALRAGCLRFMTCSLHHGATLH